VRLLARAPCVGEVMEIQSVALDADQTHSGATLMDREPFPPSAAIGWSAPDTDNAHLLALGPTTPVVDE